MSLKKLPKPNNYNLIKFEFSFKEVLPFLDFNSLYRLLKVRKAELREDQFKELSKNIDQLKDKVLKQNLLNFKGIFQLFKAKKNGNEVLLYDEKEAFLTSFQFPRINNVSLADFVSQTNFDSLALMVVSSGQEALDQVAAFQQKGEFVESLLFSNLAIAGTEAAAEFIHRKIREAWQIQEEKPLSIKELLAKKYRGVRVSFGYPCCPELSDQRKIWQLLNPDKEIGVRLTDSFMMQPELSISALVLHTFHGQL
ncbi:MAG: vitamin B12 dependent-methionine synthase activation domain-containing protein [Candidatus Margulisiibacteriota bacterium]|jgi:5-methyltetrahydrofolate--homocysteine methyltransferase